MASRLVPLVLAGLALVAAPLTAGCLGSDEGDAMGKATTNADAGVTPVTTERFDRSLTGSAAVGDASTGVTIPLALDPGADGFAGFAAVLTWNATATGGAVPGLPAPDAALFLALRKVGDVEPIASVTGAGSPLLLKVAPDPLAGTDGPFELFVSVAPAEGTPAAVALNQPVHVEALTYQGSDGAALFRTLD